MSKIQAREYVFKLTYEYLFQKIKNVDTLSEFLSETQFNDDDKNYINDSYIGIIQNYDSIIEIIKNHLNRYKIEHISKIDLAILITATYQISINKVSDIKLEINEAVEIAKKYSNDNSFKFVNGVLANIVNEQKNDGN